MAINDEIKKLESLYKKLMTEDNTPDEEAQAKMEYLEIISNIEAMIGSRMDDELESGMDSVKEALLSWDPYGPWFKEQRNLVKDVYKLIISIKKHKFTSSSGEDIEYEDIRSEVQGIRNDFNAKFKKIDEDIRNIKKSIKIIVQNIQNKLKPTDSVEDLEKIRKKVKGKPSPVPISSPIQSEKKSEKAEDIKKVRPKTRFKSIPVPTIESEQPQRSGGREKKKVKKAPIEPIQAPISIDDEEPLAVEIDPSQLKISVESVEEEEEEEIKMDRVLSERKRAEASNRGDKDKLFNILTGKDSLEKVKPQEPEIERRETSEESLFKVLSATEDEISKPISKPVTIYADDSEEDSEVIELEVGDELEEEPTEAELEEEVDPETLYQELINLEGKRYSLERSIRDLKRDREAGKISDNEYKSKLNKLVKDLQSISKRIEKIRDHLD
ncbi:MAG: hypothetical protein GF329_13940 [Candidatus Lokiarchaeota archaeon]|nr:hypothetical protein [Candidatus Lokiarchaeota archaeon]